MEVSELASGGIATLPPPLAWRALRPRGPLESYRAEWSLPSRGPLGSS